MTIQSMRSTEVAISKRSRATIVALCLAVLASVFSATVWTTLNAAKVEQAVSSGQVRGASNADQIAIATNGIFLQGEGPKGVTVDGPLGDPNSILTKINLAIDPMVVGAGLYPLRKMFEQLSVWLFLALLFLQLAKGVVLGATREDSLLSDTAKKVIVALFLMYTYPVWDIVIFRLIAIPIAGALNSSSLVGAVGSAATGMDMTNTKLTPSGEMSGRSQREQACASTYLKGEKPGEVAGCWTGNEAADAIAIQNAQMYATTSVGSVSLDAAIAACNAQPVSAWEKIKCRNAAIVQDAKNLFNGSAIRDWIGSTLMGGIASLVSLLMSIIIWFVWISVIVGRAFMLCFAPLAMAWSVSKPEKAYAWFKAHAQLCFKPAAFSAGFLVVWAVGLSILFMDMKGTGTVTGIAVKGALAVVTIMVLLKSGSLANIAGGDVAEVAGQIGSGVRDRAVQVAGTGMVAAHGAAGFIRSGGGKDIGKRVRSAYNRGGSETMIGRRLGGGIGGGIGGGWNAIKQVTKETAVGGKWAIKNRPTAAQYSGDALMSPKVWKNLSYDKYKSAATQVREGKMSAPGEKTSRALAENSERRERLIKSRRDDKLLSQLEPSIREGDKFILNAESIEAGADLNDKSASLAKKLGLELEEAVALASNGKRGINFGITSEDGIEKGSLGKASAADLTRAMDNDPYFAQAIKDIIAKDKGGADKVEMIKGRNGMIPDLEKALGSSALLNETLAAASQASVQRQEDLMRREVLSHKLEVEGGVERGSAIEVAIRNMDPKFTTDANLSGEELRRLGEGLLREAWYGAATPQDRMNHLLPAQGGEEEARNAIHLMSERGGKGTRLNGKGARKDKDNKEIKINLSDASSENSGSGLDEAIAKNIEKALARRVAEFESLQKRTASANKGGAGLGIDLAALIKTGVEKYVEEPGSLFHTIRLTMPDATDGKIYNATRREAVVRLGTAEYSHFLPDKTDNISEEDYLAQKENVIHNMMFTIFREAAKEVAAEKSAERDTKAE